MFSSGHRSQSGNALLSGDGDEKHLFLTRPQKEQYRQRTVTMISHLDTVFSEEEELQNHFTWRKEGDRIYGPGTVDIKGGTVMMYMVLDVLHRFHPEVFDSINWMIGIDACEEALSHDFSSQCLKRLPKDTCAVLVFEGGGKNAGKYSLVTSRKGRATFHVQATGRSAHAGNAHQHGANAIIQLAHTVISIADLTNYENDLTLNVGVISGGSVVNRVPHHAEAKVEMRTFRKDVFEESVRSMKEIENQEKIQSNDGYKCRISVEITDEMAPWQENRNTKELFEIWKSAGEGMGVDVVEEARGGLSDGNPLSEHFPTLDGLGPSGGNAHSSEMNHDRSKEQEFVLISSFIPKTILNTRAIIKLTQNSGL